MTAKDFDRNIFVNCPFDSDYRQLLLCIIFTTMYFGYKPRLALERVDSSENRIDKILSLIKESKFGIHDLSRIVSKSKNEKYRMNMPFELGIDFGCKKLKGGKWGNKQILILEREKYRYQAALSDLAGSDIRNHDEDEMKVVEVVRDWLVTTDRNNRGASGNKVWLDYNDFQAYLYDELVVKDGYKNVDDAQIPEVISIMGQWLLSR